LPGFAAAARLCVFHYAVILPPVTTCVDRVTSRAGHGFTSADATLAMHRDFTRAALPKRHLIADAEKAPEEIARQILDRFVVGSLVERSCLIEPARRRLVLARC
jgi:hypothetical protein